ncbi:MAG: SDR family oxidoreductase [Pseudomonadota bacterium]
MRVLVLGAYGLIGLEAARALLGAGHHVTGLARSKETGKALLPEADWIGTDLATLTEPDSWHQHLENIDAVVNAAGALQSGARDNVTRVQLDAMRALYQACGQQGVHRFVQISAVAVTEDAETEFMRTKAVADELLRGSGLDWVILKPGLVIASTAYGGTALLRTIAAFPLVQPIMLGSATIQTVHVSDVADAVVRAISDDTLLKQSFDLVEKTPQSLEHIVQRIRSHLGFGAPLSVIRVPAWIGFTVARLADIAGWLGWRSALRSTALRVLSSSLDGDPGPWRAATGAPLKSLEETLSELPSTRQERQFARLQLVWPVLLLTLALFWLASGIIGFISSAPAMALISEQIGNANARHLVHGGSVLDILIGIGLLVRRTFRLACLGAIAVSFAYVASGTFLTPELWLDPLGPFVKIFPAAGLALALLLQADER